MRYRVILLLAVAFTAFSSAMKELNQIHQFALDTSRLIAHLSDTVIPNPVPPVPATLPATIKVETCDIKQSLPVVELPWLENEKKPSAVVPRPSQLIEVTSSERRPINRTKPGDIQIAKLKKFQKFEMKQLPQIDVDPVAFEFRIPSDHDSDADVQITSEFPQFTFKTKNRRHNPIRINPRDREMLLKTLNRSINLRIAS